MVEESCSGNLQEEEEEDEAASLMLECTMLVGMK